MNLLAPSRTKGTLLRTVAIAMALLSIIALSTLPTSPAQASGATVTFIANGGAGTMATQTSSTTTPLNTNSFTRENFRFDAWTTAPNGGGTRYSDGADYPFTQDVTLYAQWLALGFIVTFNANGGSGSMDPQVATSPSPLTANSFTLTDRTFLGWNTLADGTGTPYGDGASFPFSSSGTQILYAQWSEAPTRTVTFLANGGSGTMADQSANEPSALNLVGFTRAGYVFSGWNTQANGSGSSYSNQQVYAFDADVGLFAQWTAIQTFSVTFNANGGSGVMSTQTSSVPAPLTANTFTRASSAFAGWATTATDAVVYENAEVYEFDRDITLYAKWSSAVTVTFLANADDAAGSMSTQQVGTGITLSQNAFSRPGYEFSHWTTTANGTGTKYADGWAGAIFPTNTTLYAQWSAITAGTPTVTFNANGGGGTNSMTPQSSSTPATLMANAYTAPTHRSFMNWNTEADGSGTSYSNLATFPFADSVVLYAQWGFALTLRPSGGVLALNGLSQNSVVVIPSAGEIPSSPFVRSGYEFVGWTNTTPSASNSNFYTAGESVAFSRAANLYAIWAPVTPGQMAVGFVAGGGLSANDQYEVTQSSSGAQNLIANPFTRGGYTFRGWSTTKSNQTIAFTDRASYPFDSSTLLYAVWGTNTVTFEANGGSGTVAAQASTTSRALNPNLFTRTGYLFAGWNTAPDGSGQSFAQNAWYPFSLAEKSLTLYAQWQSFPSPAGSARYVTYSGNGATSGYMTPQQGVLNTSATLTPNTFTRTGYRFAGWKTATSSGTSYTDEQSYGFTGNLTLFAQWAPLVTYKANGGVGADRTQVVTSTTPTLEPNPFTRSGYRFIGWALSSEGRVVFGEGQEVPISNIVNQGALTLFARWQELAEDQVQVTFITNYSTNGQHTMGVQNSASPAALANPPTALTTGSNVPTFTRNGFHFLGWATSSTGQVEYVPGATYPFVNDIVLWAKWQDNTVVFDANGGTGTMAAQSGNLAASLTSNAFSRVGFAFDGWATTPTGVATYSDGGAYRFDIPNSSRTLYARWVPLPGYEVVSFNSNGGSGSMAIQTVVTDGDLTLAPNGFTREGFTFTGWNARADGTGANYADGELVRVSADLTLYAKWISDGSVTSRLVTFDPNEPIPGSPVVSGSMTAQSVLGRTALNENQFTRRNAVFTGWNTAADGTEVGYADNSQIFTVSDVTLYAQWLLLGDSEVALEFRPNGGSGTPITPLAGIPSSSVTLPSNTFSRPGYQFLGWNTSETGGSASRIAPGSGYPLGATSGVLYAEWAKSWFQVSFNSNGGVGAMLAQSSDRPANLSLNAFTRDRYTFTGWDTQPDGTGNDYANAASYSFAQDLELYAQWQQTSFTVTFDPNGGTGSTPAQTASGRVTLTGNGFTRSNHRFLGWSTVPSDTAATYANGALFTFIADTRLYAVWEAVYSVNFDANAGIGVMASQTATTPTPLSLVELTREGYTFTGWNTQANGGGTSYADGARFAFTSSQTLYAQWTPTTYTVTFNSNGATGSMTSQIASGTTALHPSTLSRTGYVFRGWSTSSNATTAVYSDGEGFPFAENTILYAVWSPIFAVTYSANDGTGTMAISRSADPAPLRANAFSRTGYAFSGWNTAADGSGTPYSNQGNYPFSQNATLYSQWTQPTFTVTFDGQGGSGSMTTQSRESAGSLSRNLYGKTGYVFAGWSTTNGGSEVDHLDQALFPFIEDVTLYAVWLPAFTITFDSNDGQGTTPSQVGRGVTSISASSFVRSGYQFAGWSTTPTSSGSLLRPGESMNLVGDVTLYAHWEANTAPTRPSTRPPAVMTPPFLVPTRPTPPLRTPSTTTPWTNPSLPIIPDRQTTPQPPAATNQASPSNTVDFGTGARPQDAEDPGSQAGFERATRSLAALAAEQLSGFQPSSDITVEAVGARTTARLVLSTLNGVDTQVVLRTLTDTAAREGASFARVVEVRKGGGAPQGTWNPETRDLVNSLFQRSRLETPRWLGDLETSPDMSWVTLAMQGETYLPGSQVFLTVTSEPIVLASATVGPDGTVSLEGSVPLEVLGAGEHRFRLVGTRAFDGISVGDDGSLVVPDPVLASIQEFDLGTQATVVVTGANREGGTHQALRVIPLDPTPPWWTLLFVIWTALIMLGARAFGKLEKRPEKASASALVLLSMAPSVYFGWVSTVTGVIWWGAASAIALSALVWFVPSINSSSLPRGTHRERPMAPARGRLVGE